jgi:uncharacterized phage-like protein YoqJ
MTRENTCCFSGHRPERLPWRDNEADARCVRLKSELLAAVRDACGGGWRHFICGMARGCDTYFCETVIALMETAPNVTLEAAVPHERQSAGWAARDRARYDKLLLLCDKITVVGGERASRGDMARRNRYMADKSSLLIAVYDGGQSGGTAYTRAYAQKRGLRVVTLTPSGADCP